MVFGAWIPRNHKVKVNRNQQKWKKWPERAGSWGKYSKFTKCNLFYEILSFNFFSSHFNLFTKLTHAKPLCMGGGYWVCCNHPFVFILLKDDASATWHCVISDTDKPPDIYVSPRFGQFLCHFEVFWKVVPNSHIFVSQQVPVSAAFS